MSDQTTQLAARFYVILTSLKTYAKSVLKSSASNAMHLALCMLTAGLRNSPQCDVRILRFLF